MLLPVAVLQLYGSIDRITATGTTKLYAVTRAHLLRQNGEELHQKVVFGCGCDVKQLLRPPRIQMPADCFDLDRVVVAKSQSACAREEVQVTAVIRVNQGAALCCINDDREPAVVGAGV